VDEVQDNNKREMVGFTTICNPTPTFQDASIQTKVHVVKELKQKLDEAM